MARLKNKELQRNQSSKAVFPGLRSPACPRLALSQTLMIQLSWTSQQDEADSNSELKFYPSHVEQDPKKASPILKISLPCPHEIFHLPIACHGFRTIHNSTERIWRIFEGPSPSHQPSGFSTPTAYYQPLLLTSTQTTFKARKMAQWLRSLAALTEHPFPVLNTLVRAQLLVPGHIWCPVTSTVTCMQEVHINSPKHTYTLHINSPKYTHSAHTLT